MRGAAVVAGIGESDYFERGKSPLSEFQLALTAIRAACADAGLDRIVEFHERQDRRYAAAAREASERHQKPVLSATELVYADRAYGNAGPVGVREEGRVCYPSAHRAIQSLRALCDYAEFRATRRG